MMKSGLLISFSILIGIIIFIAVIISSDTKIILDTLKAFSLANFLILFVFYLSLFIISLARWGITINAFREKITFTKLLSIRLTEWSTSYITPFSRLGGEPFMAYLLKKEGKIKYRKGISIIIINKIMDFTSGLILAVMGLVILIVYYWNELTGRTIFLMVMATAILAYLIYTFYKKTFRKEGFFTTILKPFKELIPHKKFHSNIKLVESHLIEFFRINKKKLIILGIISLIFQILMLAEYNLIGMSLGLNLSLVQIMIINLFLILAFIIPTPGSLGGMEGAMAFVFALIGIGAGRGVAFSLVLRSVEVTLTVIGLIFAYYYSIKSFKKIVREKI